MSTAAPCHRIARKPVMVPPTLTAFTSRLPLRGRNSEGNASSGHDDSSTTGGGTSNGSNNLSTSLASDLSTDSSAISFDSDEEWEDECPQTQLSVPEEHRIVFGRLAIPLVRSHTSLLSEMLQRQQASGMALASQSGSRRGTNGGSRATTSWQGSSSSHDLPNPLRCHPTRSASHGSSTSASSQSSCASSPDSVSTSSSSSKVAHVAGGLLFMHRPPRALCDDTGPLSMPFNGASGPRSESVLEGATGTIPPLRALCHNALLKNELSSTLHLSIMEENNSRFVFRHFGSRRERPETEEEKAQPTWRGAALADMGETAETDKTDAKTGDSPRRTQSAPNVMAAAHDCTTTATTPAVPIRGKADTVVRRGVRDSKTFRFRKIEYVDDYVAPRSWSWGIDYHSKGW